MKGIKEMRYEDYKKEWEEFYDMTKRFAVSSVSIDLAKLSCINADDLANDLVRKIIEKFAYTFSHGRYYKYFVMTDWANQFVRNDIFTRSKELIEKTRKDIGE